MIIIFIVTFCLKIPYVHTKCVDKIHSPFPFPIVLPCITTIIPSQFLMPFIFNPLNQLNTAFMFTGIGTSAMVWVASSEAESLKNIDSLHISHQVSIVPHLQVKGRSPSLPSVQGLCGA